jgi:hypothetical protein
MSEKFGLIPLEEAAKHYDVINLENGFVQLNAKAKPPIMTMQIYQEAKPYNPELSQTILQGVILKIKETQKIRDFWKREFWLQEMKTEQNKYPNVWTLELWHDDTMEIDNFKKGDSVRCYVDIKGKLLTKKGTDQEFIINTLRCWQIQKIQPSEL